MRRVTMLRPILPRPTNPSCMMIPRVVDLSRPMSGRFAIHLFQQRLGNLCDEPRVRCWQMHVQCAPAGRLEGRKVAERLRELESAERKWLARNWNILDGRCRNQYKHSRVRAALVQLAGRMQI